MAAIKRAFFRKLLTRYLKYYADKDRLETVLEPDEFRVLKRLNHWQASELTLSELLNKLNQLKNGLDNTSQKILEHVCLANEIAPRFFSTGKLICQTSTVPTLDTDIAGYKAAKVNKKHYTPRGQNLLSEVFDYHNGLVLLPPAVQKKLAAKDFLDCGASWGDSALMFSQYNPKSIHCFEPSPDKIALLNEVAKANGLQDILRHSKLALGDKVTLTEEAAGLEFTTIDQYAKQNNLTVGLIKMDIEGAEYAAISGAAEIIKKQKPVLLISIYHNARDFFNIKPLIESWRDDYQFMVRGLEPRHALVEVMLIAW